MENSFKYLTMTREFPISQTHFIYSILLHNINIFVGVQQHWTTKMSFQKYNGIIPKTISELQCFFFLPLGHNLMDYTEIKD